MPPHLAGREQEYAEFDRLLEQETIIENLVLTGLRGVGKTVLLDTFKPRAIRRGWLWVGTDLSESASISESNLALRLIADLSVVTAAINVTHPTGTPVGFATGEAQEVPLSYELLISVFTAAPGLVSDKIKAVLEFAWDNLREQERHRVIFAYDEAQNLSDYAAKEQFPLSVLLDVFQSIQRKGIPFMLVLTGLPTLFPKLVDARTFAERMFRVVMLHRLTEEESYDAILKPIEVAECPAIFTRDSAQAIWHESGGYPYFIQFICREVFDVFIQYLDAEDDDRPPPSIPIEPIQRKLDSDFFAGRWARVTDRQRDLLWVIAHLEQADGEFQIQDVVKLGKKMLTKPFSPSHTNQMLASLAEQGLVYKNRFGKYSFAVPLFGAFVIRTYDPPTESALLV